MAIIDRAIVFAKKKKGFRGLSETDPSLRLVFGITYERINFECARLVAKRRKGKEKLIG